MAVATSPLMTVKVINAPVLPEPKGNVLMYLVRPRHRGTTDHLMIKKFWTKGIK